MKKIRVAVVVRYHGSDRLYQLFDRNIKGVAKLRVENCGAGAAKAHAAIAEKYIESQAPWATEIQRHHSHGTDIGVSPDFPSL